MPTALLICVENTFWNRDGSFVESFKKSFTLYVESGTKKKMEADIAMLRKQGECGNQVTKEFKENLFKIIIEHYLCKFHCFFTQHI